MLTMRARAAAWPNASWPAGFGIFSTAAIHSLDRTAHGMCVIVEILHTFPNIAIIQTNY